MHKEARQAFNESFTDARYKAFTGGMDADFPGQLDFRVAETPVFIPAGLKEKMLDASDGIIDAILSPDFREKTDRAVPKDQYVPGESAHTSFLAIDFAICRDANGELVPQLIELQGFPSLFGYQAYLAESFKKHFPIPADFNYAFGLSYESYIEKLKTLILGNEDPEQVILLDIFPEKQKTRIDFVVTEQMLGIKAVCYTRLQRDGRKLYYEKNGRRVQVKRIYNRLIFDELQCYPDLETSYRFTDEVDVTWVGHPNWFFRISKFSMPFLKGSYIPDTRFVSDYEGNYPADLENYVLKPLFSFAGSGVQLHVDAAMLAALSDPENYILQRKVTYEPVIQAPDGLVKCEIRLMYGWPDQAERPELMMGLSRLSRGEMIGVRFNKDFTWVGGSACFFEP
ncbi:hypothetical protein [Dyadobacter sandarakinus]|uniref:Circularly permuted ATP-grasp type 2 n=1 Tax=Dyadobacter sandarakinus TaxID=2747268 RepID=A0ABX7I1N4_9BACT|nr:hypothetical protein [Dyadobacter sandarakinus]QRQ99973.1 hypothetical protein HWI92_03090 [Dyadobacter sandarakinus]